MRLGLLALSLSCLLSHISGARQLRGGGQEADEVQEVRDQRSLVNTFPFNNRAGDTGHNHHDHHEHHEGGHQAQARNQFGQRQLFKAGVTILLRILSRKVYNFSSKFKAEY